MSNILNKKTVGDILVERKIITNKELQEIKLAQQSSNLKLIDVILKKGIASEEDILKAMAQYYDIKFSNKIDFNLPEEIFNQFPVSFLKKNRLVPFKKIKKTIIVAIVDPLNIESIDDLKILLPEYKFELVLTSNQEITNIIAKHYDLAPSSEKSDSNMGDIDEDELDLLGAPIDETEDILDMANEAPVIRLVNNIITQAVTERSSDIHIEPYEKDLIIRFRVDGILYERLKPQKRLQPAIISRVKIMSNLNIAENRLPQDGRIQLKIGGKDIDIRVSIFPTHYGERIVMRLLNKTDMNFDLSSIGFAANTLKTYEQLIKKPHGIVLVTGPTGSGKSTTLYSVLMKLNSTDVNILTVEDPIEYQLHGIGQMQVKPKIGLTFASGLRSILRQDPDIVMVGEIRDKETAEIAVQSALTGHRVFSTLHTNDAASGVTRLIDMGVEPFLIASSVNAFLAQRLVRTLCPHCKKSYKPSQKELTEFNLKSSVLQGGKLYIGEGCDHCLGTGYSGRTGIYELLPITNSIKKLILSHSDSGTIKETAIKEGMKTLFMDGLAKAIAGETSLEEIVRVSGI